MNYNSLIVYDFETTSKNAYRAQPIQLAAIAIDARRLEIQDKFVSYIKPIFDENKCKELGLDTYSKEAEEKTRISPSILENSSDLKVIWPNFCNWVNNFNYKKNKWSAPIRVGYNIIGYDNIIVDRICGKEPYKFGPWDDEYNTQGLFSSVFQIDLMHTVWMWMENRPDITSISFDSMREYLGLSDEAAHNAEFDVKQTAEVMIRFLKLHRHYSPKVKFKGSFASNKK